MNFQYAQILQALEEMGKEMDVLMKIKEEGLPCIADHEICHYPCKSYGCLHYTLKELHHHIKEYHSEGRKQWQCRFYKKNIQQRRQ